MGGTLKILFWLVWLGFVTYAFLLAPPNSPDTLELIINLSTGQWQGINPLVISLFNLMGIWPFIYICVMLIDGTDQRIPAWPFALGGMGVGAFAILPYLALRQPNSTFGGEKTWLLKVVDSRWLGVLLSAVTLVLLAYGITQGDWGNFVVQWHNSRFIHVMSLDFCLLSILFPVLLVDDLKRRGIQQSWIFWVVAFVPLLGPLFYLCLRPNLTQEKTLKTAP